MFDSLRKSTTRARRAFKSEDEIRAEIADSMDEVMEDIVVPKAKDNAPLGETGNLKSSIRYGGGHWRDDRYVARAGSNLEYAEAIEKGAAPHEIWANEAPYLSFYWENEGVYFRGTVVNHPGNEPHYFMSEAIRDPEVEEAMEQMVISDYEHAFRFDTLTQ